MRKSTQESPRPFFERFALPILVVAMFCLPLVARGARQALLSNRNDVSQWLPAGYPETQAFKWFRHHFAEEQFVLVSWDGCTMDDPRLETFTRKVERGIREGVDTPKGREKLFHEITTGPRLVKRLSTGNYPIEEKEVIERFSNTLIGKDGNLTSAVITFTPHGSDQGQLRKAVNVIRKLAIDECGVKPEALHMGGPPVDNVALDEAGESSLFRLAGLAAAVGLFIAWWCLRIPKLIFLVFSTGIYSAMLSLAIVYYTGTHMNAILLTMPTLVYVAAISGAIHLTNYYRESIEHDGVRYAAGRAISHAALPLGLATGTTAAGLASLCWTDLVPIFQFGLYCALGVLASALILVTVLPAALQLWPLPSHQAHQETTKESKWGDPLRTRRWRLVARGIIRHHNLVAVGCILLMFGAGYGLRYAKTSVNLMRFFAEGSKIRQDYAWLENNLGPLVPMEVIIPFDKDSKLSMLDKMRIVDWIQFKVSEVPEVGEAMSALTFAPTPDDLQAQIESRFSVGNSTLATITANTQIEKELEPTGYLRRDANGDQLWRVTARLGALDEIDYGLFVAEIQKTVNAAIDEMKSVEGTDPETFASIGEIKYTGLVPLVYTAQHTLLQDLIWGFVGDWFLVTVVMVLVIRNFSSGILLMLPAVFPAAIVFGMMGWTNILIDTGTVMTPAVALGVTVDDVVHFMLKFRDQVRLGKRRRHAIMFAYEHCAQAMYQSWGVIALGLSVFAFSPFMPTKSFGWMMLTLLTASLVGNLVMLPALLAGPLGGLFAWGIHRRDEKTARKKKPAEPHTPPVSQPAYSHATTRHSRLSDSSVPR
jgi:predicted RND superfamily exporter protein